MNGHNMKYSIIIPLYNVEKTVIRCLNSVLSQSFNTDQYEVILINDCSTDQTAKLVREIIKNQQN